MHLIQPTIPYAKAHLAQREAQSHDLSSYHTTLVNEIESGETQALPRSEGAIKDEERLEKVKKWLGDLVRPDNMKDSDYATFMRYAMEFFLDGDRLWKKHAQGEHKLVIPESRRFAVLQAVHENIGHKRFYATRAAILQRFWWPHIHQDIIWFVRTCHICQIQQTRKVLIPPTVATPAPLFSKIYVDTMHMPQSNKKRYIVQGRCSLIHYPEFRALASENGKAIGDWIFEDILCRWGALREIVTDNGQPFLKALEYLAQRYHINHIRISGYNSRANGIVERPHFDVRQALFKAVDGEENQWSRAVYSVFWAERITVRKRMGCSPYFAATGTEPLIPLDIVEATYLQPPPDSIMTTTDLIARRAIALQKRAGDLDQVHSKVYETRRKAALNFEKKHAKIIRDFNFKQGALVLLRNSAIEKSLNRKMKPRYLGPLIVVSRNWRGAYIVCELDGSVFDRPIAAFRLIPYFARKSIPFPTTALDVDARRIQELEGAQLEEVLDGVDDETEGVQDVTN
jgi:hypothetical protein